MLPGRGAVQFFDLVEVDWRSDPAAAPSVGLSSGCTAGATEATSIVAKPAGSAVAGLRPSGPAVSTGRPKKAAWIIETASVPGVLADAPVPWGIMVPKS